MPAIINRRGILFNTPMVQAIKENIKTQTRRAMNPQPPDEPTKTSGKRWGTVDNKFYYCGIKYPYGFIGDNLYVRETWSNWENGEGLSGVDYRADRPNENDRIWKPSIHMPREFSRIELTITEIRAEDVRGISEEDAKSEGAIYHNGGGAGHSGYRYSRDGEYVFGTAKEAFLTLWRSIYGEKNWAWVTGFKVVEIKK